MNTQKFLDSLPETTNPESRDQPKTIKGDDYEEALCRVEAAYSGPVNCSKCGRQHWIGAECQPAITVGSRVRVKSTAECFPGQLGTVSIILQSDKFIVELNGGKFPYRADELELLPDQPAATAGNPKIVCLCGSSRHPDLHMRQMMEETLAGNIVVPMGIYGHADFPAGAKAATNDGDESTAVKQMLDRLHFAKISLAEVVIITVDNYIGSSTAREKEFAEQSGKVVRIINHPATQAMAAKPTAGPWDAHRLHSEAEAVYRELRLTPRQLAEEREALSRSLADSLVLAFERKKENAALKLAAVEYAKAAEASTLEVARLKEGLAEAVRLLSGGTKP